MTLQRLLAGRGRRFPPTLYEARQTFLLLDHRTFSAIGHRQLFDANPR
jgi:hypothetical protein